MLKYESKRFVEKYGLDINFDIPNTMNVDGLIFLAALAKTFPENGTVVEAGSLYGSTAYVFAKNAPSNTVYCIDPWKHEPWMTKWMGDGTPKAPYLSPEAFKAYVYGLDNIVPIHGYSPDAYTREGEIDVFFEDSTHSDPVFTQNMNRFCPLIKPGGLLCGDDFGDAFPDVKKGALRVHDDWGLPPSSVRGSVWAFCKSGGPTLGERLGNVFEEFFDMSLSLETGETVGTAGFGFAVKEVSTGVTQITHPDAFDFVLRLGGKDVAASDHGVVTLAADTLIDEIVYEPRYKNLTPIADFTLRGADGTRVWSKRTGQHASSTNEPGVLTNLRACFRVA